MANFIQAMKWMEEGKKVRISDWENKEYYWHVPNFDEYTFDNLWFIKQSNGEDGCFIRSWIESEDWEIFYAKVEKSEVKEKKQ